MKKTLLASQRIIKAFTFEAKIVDEEKYIIEGIFSTPVVDRHGEVVIQEGWKLDEFLKNPVVLWSHDNYQFPLAQMISIGFEGGNLVGKMKFAVEEYEVAATAFRLMKGKFLRAFSVGFINNVYEVDNDSEVVKLVENVLMEVSVVNVPANQEALAKIKSIDVLNAEEKIEVKIDKDVEEKSAVETLSKSNFETIRTAIRTLTEVLNAATEADKQVGQKVEHPGIPGGIKKIPVKLLNRAVKELLGIKKSQ